ncbi:class I SAM-dependent methyltransferase [Paraburkholderia antibiotica]|uniref:Methyltransferase domain-containing protein n=1 Tax=Paraburkholderia antibiotica TaxID=2728839 RepID=A0A7Y0A0N6_9BURK|nr:hypothetical protein [Paraburkholderia antibiotica]NML34329.1 hypothetical protein [Paraburkholderia antibiotica]
MNNFSSGSYWSDRSDLLYYRYVDYMIRTIGRDASSLLDVGSGNCPYLEWFDWIPGRYSIDLEKPYQSEDVVGIKGNIFDVQLTMHFDVLTCLQVLEHVPDAGSFAQRLLQMANTLVVSVPYKWPKGKDKDHVHDPVDETKLEKWFGRKPNYSIVVREPFLWVCHERIICIYDSDPEKKYGVSDRFERIMRIAQ